MGIKCDQRFYSTFDVAFDTPLSRVTNSTHLTFDASHRRIKGIFVQVKARAHKSRNELLFIRFSTVHISQHTNDNLAIFISLIRACVANEILKWVGCVRRGVQSSELSVGV